MANLTTPTQITAQELRIGNWVWLTPAGRFEKGTKHLAKVENVGADGINVRMAYYDTGEFLEWESDIEPVLITLEILEKAGFNEIILTRTADGNKIIYETITGIKTVGSRQYKLYHLMIGDTWALVNVSITDGYEVACVRYLHQLQNLYFALTGEELPITL
jgi:hypothetical protein